MIQSLNATAPLVSDALITGIQPCNALETKSKKKIVGELQRANRTEGETAACGGRTRFLRLHEEQRRSSFLLHTRTGSGTLPNTKLTQCRRQFKAHSSASAGAAFLAAVRTQRLCERTGNAVSGSLDGFAVYLRCTVHLQTVPQTALSDRPVI